MAGFKLVTGVTVHIKFTYANTATNAPTLSINSSTAKPIVQYGSTAVGTTAETSGWQAGAVLSLTYDGTSWVRDQGYNTNDNTTYSVFGGSGSGHSTGLVPDPGSTAGSSKFLCEDGSWTVVSTSDTKVTQAYSTLSGSYPVLLSSIDGISSTSSRGDTTSILNNQLFFNPNAGSLHTTKLSINETTGQTEKLYVNGTIQFYLGSSNTDSSYSKFIVSGASGNKISIGSDGLQAYNGSSGVTTLNLQKSGGNLQIGSSTYESATRDLYGIFDFKTESGFKYSAMTAGTHNISRPIWFMSASGTNATTLGVPQYDDDFSYNPSTNTLTIGTGTLTATNYDGTAAKATADASGNTITTTYATIVSPEFTGTPKSITPTTNSDNTMIATKEYVDNSLSVADALTYKGVLSGANDTTDGGTLTPAGNCGDVYKVDTAGYINGIYVQVGDMLICTTDNTSAATTTNFNTVKANWNIIQTSEGTVTGPVSATDEAIVRFDGVTGQLIQDSKITINDDGKITAPHIQNKTTGIQFTYSSTIDFSIGVSGTDNTTHGLYDTKATKWILSAGSDNKWSLDGNAATATQFAAAQKVYVDLTTASTTTTIQGGSSSAEAIGVDGQLGVGNGGTGAASFTANQVILSNATSTTGAFTSLAYTDNSSATALAADQKFVTERSVYYGLPNINGVHTYTSSTDIYAPTSSGTANHILISGGTSTAPSWTENATLSSGSGGDTLTLGAASKPGSLVLYDSASTATVTTFTSTGWSSGGKIEEYNVLGQTSTTANTDAYTILSLGNSGNITTTNAHSQGILRLYAKGTNYTDIITDNQYTKQFIIPDYNGNMNAVHTGATVGAGTQYIPVYINSNGLATETYPVQYFTWTIGSGKKGVQLTDNSFSENTYPLVVMVTEGDQYLNDPIEWTNGNHTFTLQCDTATSGIVTGYCIVAHGDELSPSSTDVT